MRPVSAWFAALLASASFLPACLQAAESPEIKRSAGAPQKVGVLHTLRSIPEACVRIEGRFTGQAAQPYAFTLVRTHPGCQPRAQWIDDRAARPSTAGGWVLNDVVRVPNAVCPTQQAVLRVWRRPGGIATPALDGQGRARVYLADTMKPTPATTRQPAFSAVSAVEGRACAAQ